MLPKYTDLHVCIISEQLFIVTWRILLETLAVCCYLLLYWINFVKFSKISFLFDLDLVKNIWSLVLTSYKIKSLPRHIFKIKFRILYFYSGSFSIIFKQQRQCRYKLCLIWTADRTRIYLQSNIRVAKVLSLIIFCRNELTWTCEIF